MLDEQIWIINISLRCIEIMKLKILFVGMVLMGFGGQLEAKSHRSHRVLTGCISLIGGGILSLTHEHSESGKLLALAGGMLLLNKIVAPYSLESNKKSGDSDGIGALDSIYIALGCGSALAMLMAAMNLGIECHNCN